MNRLQALATALVVFGAVRFAHGAEQAKLPETYVVRLCAVDAAGKKAWELSSASIKGERVCITEGRILSVVLPEPALTDHEKTKPQETRKSFVQEVTVGLQWSVRIKDIRDDGGYAVEMVWSCDQEFGPRQLSTPVDRRTRHHTTSFTGQIDIPIVVGSIEDDREHPKEQPWTLVFTLTRPKTTQVTGERSK